MEALGYNMDEASLPSYRHVVMGAQAVLSEDGQAYHNRIVE